jgi:hypothetical protein
VVADLAQAAGAGAGGTGSLSQAAHQYGALTSLQIGHVCVDAEGNLYVRTRFQFHVLPIRRLLHSPTSQFSSNSGIYYVASNGQYILITEASYKFHGACA